MMIAFSGGSICGTAKAPPSKSVTQRAVFMSALCRGESVIRNPSLCGDVMSSLDVIRRLGASVKVSDGTVRIAGGKSDCSQLDCGNSGTALRFAAGLASLRSEDITITGDDSLRTRPMAPLLEALSSLGAVCSSADGHAPITVRGPIKGGNVSVRGDISSQFASSLMIAAPAAGGMSITIEGRRTSAPYLEMTADMLRHRGIPVTVTGHGYDIGAGDCAPSEIDVPGDWSSAAYILAAGALGGSATVTGIHDDKSGDGRITELLSEMGAEVIPGEGSVTCRRRGRLRAVDADMSDTPDLFPIAAVLLSTADGESELYGAPGLRFKESDRIGLTADMLNTLGADVTATDEGCRIRGRTSLTGGNAEHRGDHRMMMAAAVASLCCEQPVTVMDDGCWNVSFPGFPETMASIGLRCRRCTR